MESLSSTKFPGNTIVRDFSQAKFPGLDKTLVETFLPALERTQRIDRFLNDDFVADESMSPSLYIHIFNGLQLAKEKVFSGVDEAKKLIEDFNKAYMVHDFGEMMMEFSTFFGRHHKQEDSDFDRDTTERDITKVVFQTLKKSSNLFRAWFSEINQNLKAATKYPEKVSTAQAKLKDLKQIINSKAKEWSSTEEFTKEWLGFFDLSQKAESLKTSFVGNLVKVVDKLEGQIQSRKIHNPSKITANFIKGQVKNYLHEFKTLSNASETTAIQAKSPQERVFNNLDKWIRTEFETDNRSLLSKADKDNPAFESFEQALALSS